MHFSGTNAICQEEGTIFECMQRLILHMFQTRGVVSPPHKGVDCWIGYGELVYVLKTLLKSKMRVLAEG